MGMRNRLIRIDAYIGFDDEDSPRKREQFLFNIANDELDDMPTIVTRDLEDAIGHIINEVES